MQRQPMGYEFSEDYLAQLQGELLDALLQSEDLYPWNPAEVEAEAYFREQEQELTDLGWLEDSEIICRADAFFTRLHQCWEPTIDLKAALCQQFAHRAPQAWIEAIALQAQNVVSTQLSLADQLVDCVKSLLSNWAEDDLYLFARPYANVMRDTPQEMRLAEWTELSAVEQARLSMAIARYAIDQLEEQ